MKSQSKELGAMRDARAKLVWLMPYLQRAIYALVFYETDGTPTMSVDRWRRVYFNPNFVAQLNIDQLVLCIYHELCHVTRHHCDRATQLGVSYFNAALVNVCQDMEINDDIAEAIITSQQEIPMRRLTQIPSWTILQGKHAGKVGTYWQPHMLGLEPGKTWEQYYFDIVDSPRSKNDTKGIPLPVLSEKGDDHGDGDGLASPSHDCGSGSHGVKRAWEHGEPGVDTDADGVSDADWLDVERQVAEAILSANAQGKGVPGGWLRWAQKMLVVEPIPWDQLLDGKLRNTISMASGMVLHTWQRPSRRATALGNVMLPHMRRPKPEIVIVGDTSGSMGNRELGVVRGTVESLCEGLGVTPTFISVDEQVHGKQVVSGGAEIEFGGGGGTDMCVGIEEALEHRPDGIVVITDCLTPWPEVPTPVPLIVCDVSGERSNLVPDWAEYIGVKISKESEQ